VNGRPKSLASKYMPETIPMSAYFCLSIQLLDRCFHGNRNLDHSEYEWPPSPARAYQALVAAAAARSRGKPFSDSVRSALEWLERQPAPQIIAPRCLSGVAFRSSVPHNAMDVVARAWTRGNYSNTGDANPATHRTMKTVRHVHLVDGQTVHYLWVLQDNLSDEIRRHTATLSGIAHDVIALGWGIDMAVGHGSVTSSGEVERLTGERWFSSGESGAAGLRVPVAGMLTNLISRHERFLERPRPLLHTYRTVVYRRSFDPASRPYVVFRLLDPESDRLRPFDPVRHTVTVARLMRHTTKVSAQGRWGEDEISRMIMGHGEARDADAHSPVLDPRFAFISVPTIASRPGGRSVVESIRRVMLTSFAEGFGDKIDWAQRFLPGQELHGDKQPADSKPLALISPPAHDAPVSHYVERATTWATVSPMVLPGYDDPAHYRRRLRAETSAPDQTQLLSRLDTRIDGLIRKAIRQAGFSEELAAYAEIGWRMSGFFPGVDLAGRYVVPQYLKRFSRLHVRIRWRDSSGAEIKIPGPICLGGGRFVGLGLFAALS
jgi:CRISPR-associated protein Csb2